MNCPSCGTAEAYVGFSEVECLNKGCQWFKAPKPYTQEVKVDVPKAFETLREQLRETHFHPPGVGPTGYAPADPPDFVQVSASSAEAMKELVDGLRDSWNRLFLLQCSPEPKPLSEEEFQESWEKAQAPALSITVLKERVPGWTRPKITFDKQSIAESFMREFRERYQRNRAFYLTTPPEFIGRMEVRPLFEFPYHPFKK